MGKVIGLIKRICCLLALVFLAQMVWAAYSIDPNKVGMVGGTHVSSQSYNLGIATEQESIGEVSSSSYVTRLGWIYTIEDTPTVSDENVSPENWFGIGALILGFQCHDPNGISDFNNAQAAITGANTADLNNISYAVSGQVAIIALDISSYITTKGTYYVTPFCFDDENNVGVGSRITGNYLASVTINVQQPVQDANINSNPVISFDVNRHSANNVDQSTITVDLNGTASTDFDATTDCTASDGNFYCSYTETGLAQDEDNSVAFNASDSAGNPANQVERLLHYDATAPVVSSVSASALGNNVVVSWSGSDGFTGVETYYVRHGSGKWTRVGKNNSYNFSGHGSSNRTYSVKAKDFADNNSLIVQEGYSAPIQPATAESPVGIGGLPKPAEVGIFEIEIVRVDSPVEATEKFDFTYIVRNNTRNGDSVYVEYWLDKNGEILVSGSETIYLLPGQEMEVSESLPLLEGMDGSHEFHIVLEREEQETISVVETTTIMLGAPTVIDLKIVDLEPGKGAEPLSFSLEVGSNRDQALGILVQERLFREERVVWEKKQTIPVAVFGRFFEEVHGLESGDYRLEVSISFEDQEKRVVEEFERKPVEPILIESPELLLPIFVAIPWILLLLVLALLALFYTLVLGRNKGLQRKATKREKLGYLTMACLMAAILYLLFLYWQLGAVAGI